MTRNFTYFPESQPSTVALKRAQIAQIEANTEATARQAQQEQASRQLIENYLQAPNQQNLARVAAYNPQAATSIMAANKAHMTGQAKKVRSLHNTWQRAPLSQKPALYEKWRKENQQDMEEYPLEYNEKTAQEIETLLNQDNFSAMQVLGEGAGSTVGKIQEDLAAGRLTPELAGRATEKAVSTKPTTIVTIAGKAPTGYRFEDPQDPTSPLTAIAGGPAEKLSAEAAGKTALVEQGLRDTVRFEKLIFDKKGNLNRGIVTLLNSPYIPPSGKARRAYSAIFNAINARLRLESGAAVPEPEVVRAMKAFLPAPLDDKKTAKFKVDRMKEFFDIFQETLGTGRSPAPQPIPPPPQAAPTPEEIQAEIKKRRLR